MERVEGLQRLPTRATFLQSAAPGSVRISARVPSEPADAHNGRHNYQQQQQPAVGKRSVLPLKHLGTGHDLVQAIGRLGWLDFSLNLIHFHLGAGLDLQSDRRSARGHVSLLRRRQSRAEIDDKERWNFPHALILWPE